MPLLSEAAEQPEKLVPVLSALLEEPGGVRIDALKGALDYLSPQDWYPLIETALDTFSRDPFNKVALSILGSGLFQAPAAFHPHLKRIFFEMESFLEEFGPGVWRGSTGQSLDFLRQVLGNEDTQLHARALEVLQQTHDPGVISFTHQEEQRLGLQFYQCYACNQYAYNDYFDIIDGEVKLLYPQQAYHLYFPPDYLSEHMQSPPLHPTWVNTDPKPQQVAFGGVLDQECTACGRNLQHLLTLEPLPPGLGVTGLPRLKLVVCTNHNCLQLGLGAEIYYHHDEEGYPHGLHGKSEKVDREGKIPFITSTTALLGKTKERWKWQDYGSRSANLHRLGGLPSWVQEPGHPGCSRCGQSMTFLMQLDSGLLTQDGGYMCWCSGLLYAFWCDRCKVSAFFRQCC